MYELLRDTSRRASLHMPGAQGRAPFGRVDPYRLDTTELPVTDDLYRPSGAIARAQALAAKSAGAANTLLLHGGSTAGAHAMLLYAARRGDEVILPRNAHISAIYFCALHGLAPVFAEPSYTPCGRPYTTLENYTRAMEKHPNARAVLVVCPDYYGAMLPLEDVCEAAHSRGMLLLCDEAHGAHFNWDAKCRNALASGADLAVQSAHKTLPALTAGAWLHASAGIDADRLRQLLRMVQTSSPSFINMLSLDDARAWMDAHGAAACERLHKATEAFYHKAGAMDYGDGQADFPGELGRDRLRVVLNAPQGGFRLGEQLAALGIDVEMCDEYGIVCILSLLDGDKRLKRLYNALRMIAKSNGEPKAAASAAPVRANSPALRPPAPPGIPPRAVPLCEAAFAAREPVALERCAGRVSAVQAGAYPPGVALLTAGEIVTPEIAAYLSAFPNERLFGVNPNGSLDCISQEE